MKEITTATPQELHDAWPEVSYRGQAFFDDFYAELERLEARVFQRSDFQDRQEVYVGYLPETDEFLVGWDAWHRGDANVWGDDMDDTDYAGCKVQVFKAKWVSATKLQLELVVADDRLPVGLSEDIFYRKAYKALRASLPTLVDLRLD